MKTDIIPINHPAAFSTAKNILDRGGIIAFPTDTVYGIAAKINHIPGINRIYEVKGRDFAKAIPVLIGDITQLDIVALEINQIACKLIDRFWPGALTLVVLRQPGLPSILSSYPTVGIRMPDYVPALQLMKITGPLATTSANISGQKNTTSPQEVVDQLNGRIELILDGGPTLGDTPSTIVDCTNTQMSVLREGIITASDIHKCISEE